MKRSSTVLWKGSGKEGQGRIDSQSGALDNAFYAWNTRFEDEKGTNPEELLAAAHASCFTMKLSFLLSEDGHTPVEIKTTSTVTMEGGLIDQSHLVVKASVPGMTEERFIEYTEKAKNECPMSRALNLKITLEASLKVKTHEYATV